MKSWLALAGLLCCLPAWASVSTREQVELPLDSGRVLQAELRLPRDADGPLPVVLLFGGFRGAATVLDAVPQNLSLIAASFDYPFDPPRRFRFPQSFGDIPAIARGIDETFEGIALLMAHLRARADVDAARITIVGASLGAPFAVISAVESDIPGVVVVHGFGELRRVIAHQFIRKLEPRWGAWTRAPSWSLANALVWGLRLPSPEDYAPRLAAHQRVLMVAAADDELIPRRASDTLRAALERSQAQVEYQEHVGEHLQGRRDPRIAELVGVALEWMQRQDLR